MEDIYFLELWNLFKLLIIFLYNYFTVLPLQWGALELKRLWTTELNRQFGESVI